MNKLSDQVKKYAYDTADLMSHMVDQGAKPSEGLYGEAEKLLDERKKESYGLRHPYVTGIPTLGVWPLISIGNAQRKIVAKLMAKHPELAEQYREYADKRYEQSITDRQLSNERDKANAMRNTIMASAVPLAYYASARSRKDE